MPHIHEKIDFTASAYIVHKGTVLLRKHDKFHVWLSVGGHIELNEDPNEAVIREVKEEVGLDVTLVGEAQQFKSMKKETELIPPRFMNRHEFTAGSVHEHIDLVYFARTESTDIVENEHEKSPEIKWFTKEELSDPALDIWERVRYYALTALEEVV